MTFREGNVWEQIIASLFVLCHVPPQTNIKIINKKQFWSYYSLGNKLPYRMHQENNKRFLTNIVLHISLLYSIA